MLPSFTSNSSSSFTLPARLRISRTRFCERGSQVCLLKTSSSHIEATAPATGSACVILNFFDWLIFMAGLQVIPAELYEAADLDGAGAWARFRHITLPGLAPVFLFVGITTMIGYFQLFAEPYVMTQGGPLGATRSVVLFMYEEGFRWWRMGVASAVAVLLLLITLVGALLQLRVTGRGR